MRCSLYTYIRRKSPCTAVVPINSLQVTIKTNLLAEYRSSTGGLEIREAWYSPRSRTKRHFKSNNTSIGEGEILGSREGGLNMASADRNVTLGREGEDADEDLMASASNLW